MSIVSDTYAAGHVFGNAIHSIDGGAWGGTSTSAHTGEVDTSTSLMGYVKQLVNQQPRVITVTTPSAATTAWTQAAHALATATGTVKARVFGDVGITLVGAGTLEVGVAGATASMIAQVANATTLAAGDMVTNATTASLVPAGAESPYTAFSDLDIDLTVGTANITAGQITFYIEWVPLSAGATLVAATWD